MELLSSLLSTLRTSSRQALEQEYKEVRAQTLVLKDKLALTCEAGALKENSKKNRYKDILPYDQSRVLLSLLTSDHDSDYINANFIQGASAGRSYIACQGPLSCTLTDFWRMIWQHDIKVIAMACREIEMGKRKCECYWAALHHSASFGPFAVCNQGEASPSEHLVVRSLTVTYQQVSRPIQLFHFLSWPDHDVPYETAGVLDLLEQIRDTQGTHTSPLLIHCSAGCGRTGVICALDYIHDLLVTERLEDFSIMQVVVDLRRQRPAAVQTKEQYLFIYSAVICMFERILQREKEKPEKITAGPSLHPRVPRQTAMSDTYAVVNKFKPYPPSESPAHCPVAPPRPIDESRAPPSTHHYDNDGAGASVLPVYSAVKPRVKPISSSHSASAIYDMATSNPRLGEGPVSPGHNTEYHLVSAEHHGDSDAYEDVCSAVTGVTMAPGAFGFNCRVQKPRGPREPPAEWSRLER
ncbi:tyrosine-protein phosphatase non-receptor type 18 [Genypterus blacodes]|uniref:tyrosine-protein phosphatase non-receptor type 18 n=1 Tax=Genypterus blacodes TaxID=154954 RepID=UPI003F76204A